MIVRLARLRPAVQVAFFIFFIAIFLALAYPAGSASNLLLAMDPLAAMASAIFFRGAWLPALLPAAGLLFVSVLLGRAFCGWACPAGFLQDVAGKARLTKRASPSRDLEYLRMGILAAVLVSSMFTLEALAFADPLVVFQRSAYALWSGSGVPVLPIVGMLIALAVPRLWCRVCPLGGLLGIAGLFSPFGRRVSADCTQCAKCGAVCPTGAIAGDNEWHASSCIKCLECERACPEKAIGFSASAPSPARGISLSRRSAVVALAGLGSLALAKVALPASGAPLLRPPGSLAEAKFNAACLRCGSCMKACAGKALRPAGPDGGLERMFTPVLDFNAGKCERCCTCGTVCPSGAVISIPEANIKIGTAAIDAKRCLAWAQHKKCLVCAEVCPAGAVKSADVLRPAIDEAACIGCGSCQLNCPAGEKAVVVTVAGERRRDG